MARDKAVINLREMAGNLTAARSAAEAARALDDGARGYPSLS